jgi:Xaa-Pro aminopeptidase
MNKSLSEIRKTLEKKKLDALLVTKHDNVRYVSHFTGTNKKLFITKRRAYLLTDSRYHVRARKEVPQDSGIEIIEVKETGKTLGEIAKNEKIIGFEAHDVTITELKRYKKLLKNRKWKAITDIIEEIRAKKDDSEIRKIKKSCQILGKVFKDLKKDIKTGIREQDLAWKVRELAYKEGADDIAFDPIIAFGKNSALPHHKSDDTKLKASDHILIDIGVMYKGYASDITRIILPKKPQEKLLRMIEACSEAKNAAELITKDGIKGKKVDAKAREVLKKHSFDMNFTHALGHGVGINVHEKPGLSPISKDTLREGMVFTIEPGIYLENFGGVRLEDTYTIKNGKAVALTDVPMKQMW